MKIDRTRIDLLVLPRAQPAESEAAPSDGTASRQLYPFRSEGFRSGVTRGRAGFAIGPVLYLLALLGIGAGILFSGYSQILRSNMQITQGMETQNDLTQAATVLAASSILGGSDNTYLCPPTAGSPSSNCSLANVKLEPFTAANAAQLPANYSSAGTTGTPPGFEVGVFAPGSGMKQLDPYGHYYIVCRWENQTTNSTNNSIMVVSAGADGTLSTPCGATTTTPNGDDQVVAWTAPYAVQHSAIWQTTTGGQGNETYFGNVGHQLEVDAMGDLTVPGALSVTGTATFGNIGTFAGAVTAPTFNGNLVGGTVSATTGAFSGLLQGNGGLTVSSSALTIDTSGDITAGGTLGVTGATTLSSTLGVTGQSTLSGGVTISTGSGNALSVTGTSVLGGTTTPFQVAINPLGYVTANGGFIGNLSGNVTGNLTGNQSGGSISATSGAFSSALSVGGSSNVNITPSGNGTFSGTVTAASFDGNLNLGSGGGTTITGMVPLSNGGTGIDASSNANLLYQLGVLNASNYLNMTLVQSGSVTDSMLESTVGGSGGTFYSVTVNAEGIVTGGSTTPPADNYITDGSDSVIASNGEISFTTSGVENDIINSQGWLGVLTPTPVVPLTVGNPYAALNSNEVAQFASGGATSTIDVRSASGGVTSAGILGVTTSGSATTVTLGTNATSGTSSIALQVGGATQATIDGSGDVVATNFDGNLVGGTISGTSEQLTGTLTGTSAYFSGTVTANNISAATGYFSGTVTASGFSGNISGLISIPDGTVGAPGLFFTSEVNTGLFRPGADHFGFAVGGVQALELETASGGVDYLTITPAASSSAPAIGVAGSVNEGLALSSNGSGSITLTPGSTGAVSVSAGNLNIASGALQISSTGVLAFPVSNADKTGLAVGPGALSAQSVSAGYNTAAGNQALNLDTTGINNTAVGYQALASTSTGGSNVAIGEKAGSKITSGSSNIVIGALSASTTLTTGGSNILIGNALDTTSSAASNQLNIGGLLQGNTSGISLGIGQMPQAGAVLDLSGGNSSTNSSMILPGSTIAGGSGTADRPAGITGMVRYNSDTLAIEAFLNGQWTTLLSDTSSAGGGASSGLYIGTQTTANPMIYGEPTSGFYTPGANTIAAEVGGTPALYINSSAEVGIGTTGPGAMLQINSSGTGAGGIINENFASQTANNYVAENSSGTAYVTIGPDTLSGTSQASNFFNVTGTLPGTDTAVPIGVHVAITSAGSSAKNQAAAEIDLAAGYTGANATDGLVILNKAAGTGTGGWSANGADNMGINAGSIGTAAGNNVGGSFYADSSSSLNLGLLGGSFSNANSPALNVGVAGEALSATVNVGGFFGLFAEGTTPAALSSAALVADNGASGSPIFLGRVNGTAVDAIDGNGNLGIGTTAPTAGVALDLLSETTTANSSLGLPGGSSGTTGRPTTGVNGMIRYNNSTPGIEAYYGSAWNTLLSNTTSITSGVYLGSQTTANPSIDGERTSGFYTPGANTIAVQTAGSTALTVTATQSVGIGTTGPASALDVNGDIRSDAGAAAAGGSCTPNGATVAAAANASGQNLICTSGAWAVVSSASSEPTWHVTTFTSSGTWTLPAGVYSIDVFLAGGGGGGGGGGSGNNYQSSSYPSGGGAGGGGGGGGGLTWLTNVPVTGNLTVTVGSGGIGSSGGLAVTTSTGNSGTVGSAGSATSIAIGGVTVAFAAGGNGGGAGGGATGCITGGCNDSNGGISGGGGNGGSGTGDGAGGTGGGGGSGGNSSAGGGAFAGNLGSAGSTTVGTVYVLSSAAAGSPGTTVGTASADAGGGGTGGGGGASYGSSAANGGNGGNGANNTGGAGSAGGSVASANTGGGGAGGGGGGGAYASGKSSGAGGTGGNGSSGYAVIWALY